MALSVRSIQEIRNYFQGVVERSDHHAPTVSKVIYPLLGFVILNMDEDSDIEVRSYDETAGNMLWFFKNSIRYAFKYEHSDGTIELHKTNYKGPLIRKFDNKSSISMMKKIFESL